MTQKLNYLIFFMVIFSCENREGEQKNKIFVDDLIKTNEYSLNNPVLFMGSTFGHFIQGLHKLGDYQHMLEFTSRETRGQFSDSMLLEFYQGMDFSYSLKLKSSKNNTLFYSTRINATEKTIQIVFKIENDTCRLVLRTLHPQKPFVGI